MSSITEKISSGLAWRTRRVKRVWHELHVGFKEYQRSRQFKPVDERIVYPCYKSFDSMIDIDRLKSLDNYIKDKVMQVLRREEYVEKFHSGFFKDSYFSRSRPGTKLIGLTASKRSFHYWDLNDPEMWEPTPCSEEFSELMDFIATLPFKATARMIIMADEQGRAVTMHRDHVNSEISHEFIWFRTNLEKPFFVQARTTKEKKYVESYSAWFDTVNQFHGGDETGKLAISIRVDGVFSDALRAKIPQPGVNASSTAALWASLSNGGQQAEAK